VSHELFYFILVCRNRDDHQVVKADCRVSPFRDSIADAAICIAVIHHLTTDERRLKTLIDISRTLLPHFKYFIPFYNLFYFFLRCAGKGWSSSNICLGQRPTNRNGKIFVSASKKE
jgi:hypothetical protein